jgi:hypothetical protein
VLKALHSESEWAGFSEISFHRRLEDTLFSAEHKFFDFESLATVCFAPSIDGLGFKLPTQK